MFVDGHKIELGETLNCDVCIIGAGAAGLTLAQAFDAAPFSVLLLESGSFTPDPLAQSLSDGTAASIPYPFSESRARCFGGTTTRWSGVCVPLDAGDFESKPWLPYSGWPFERAHLQPYYERAKTVFGLSTLAGPIPETPFHQFPLETKIVQYSNPLDLGRKYKQQIVRSQNITLITHATVVQLVPTRAGQKISHLEVKTPSQQEFLVKPQTVILASGGIENARLLLASTRYHARGVGNTYHLVGRFFMEHYYKVVGILPVDQHRQTTRFFTNFCQRDNIQTQGTFGLTDQVRNQQQLLNMHVRLYRYSLLEDTPAVITAKRLSGLWQQRKLASTGACFWQLKPDSWKTLSRYATWHFWHKLNASAAFRHVRLQAWIEQEPDPANCIRLSQQRDYFGQPQAHLDFRFSEQTWKSIDQSLLRIDQALKLRGFGRLQADALRLQHLEPYDKLGLHHMGTTRMHKSPLHGVVDVNCKVHDLANLYIAGSSVFPTGGAANPTLTIAALAIRLADHIHQLYRN